MRYLELALAAAACTLLSMVAGHPLCLGDVAPNNVPLAFCNAYNNNQDQHCCVQADDNALQQSYNDAVANSATPVSQTCQDLHKQVTCAQCHPWAFHIFSWFGDRGSPNTPSLKADFCAQYTTACGAALRLPADYCATHTVNPDTQYAFPYDAVVDAVSKTARNAFGNMAVQDMPRAITNMIYRPDTAELWWVVSHPGKIYEVRMDATTPADWRVILDVTDTTHFSGEMGLTSVLPSTTFANDGFVWIVRNICIDGTVNCQDNMSSTQLSRMKFDFNSDGGKGMILKETEQVLLGTHMLSDIHNIGSISWRPSDGQANIMYVLVGDGGGDTSVDSLAQDMSLLYGKILRIVPSVADNPDPATGLWYTIPNDNPFYGVPGVRQEIYAYGCRNPWRGHWDAVTDTFIYGSIGQASIESVYKLERGANYGWPTWEGPRCTLQQAHGCLNPIPNDLVPAQQVTFPMYQYCHMDYTPVPAELTPPNVCGDQVNNYGNAVLGGYVYRGSAHPQFYGWYIWMDYGRLTMHALRQQNNGVWSDPVVILNLGVQASGMAQGPDGELYILGYSTQDPTQQTIYMMACGEFCPETTSPTPAPTSAPTELTREDVPGLQYVGCYADPDGGRVLTGPAQTFYDTATPQVCNDFCASQTETYAYAGTQYYFECRCGNDLGNQGAAAETECNLPCAGDQSQVCGGIYRNSVYQVTNPNARRLQTSVLQTLPTAPAPTTNLGCWANNAGRDRAMTVYQPCNGRCTLAACAAACTDPVHYPYFGLEYGGQCWCGTSYSGQGQLPASRCDLKCPDGAACGGANALTVYQNARRRLVRGRATANMESSTCANTEDADHGSSSAVPKHMVC